LDDQKQEKYKMKDRSPTVGRRNKNLNGLGGQEQPLEQIQEQKSNQSSHSSSELDSMDSGVSSDGGEYQDLPIILE